MSIIHGLLLAPLLGDRRNLSLNTGHTVQQLLFSNAGSYLCMWVTAPGCLQSDVYGTAVFAYTHTVYQYIVLMHTNTEIPQKHVPSG